MKKFLLGLVALFGLAVASSEVEAQSFVKGDNIVSAKVGLGTDFDFSGIPPIGITYEHGLIDDIFKNGWNVNFGLGAEADFWSKKYTTILGNSNYYHSFLGVRGVFHKEFVKNLDTYAGVSLGMRYNKHSIGDSNNEKVLKEFGYKDNQFDFGYSTFVGCRYYFHPNWAVNAEAGWGVSLINVGMTYKF